MTLTPGEADLAVWPGLDCVGRRLTLAARLARQVFDRRLAAAGSTFATYVTLGMVGEHGPVIQRRLAAILGVEAATLTRQLERLERDRLVAREPAAGDHRAMLVRLTDHGRSLLSRLVVSVGAIGAVSASIYKNDRIPAADTEAISVDAADPGLLGTVEAHLYRGLFLNAATSRYPAAVLGSDAASALGIDQPGTQAWLGGRWFTVVGIMQPVPLAPELDRAALIGFAEAAGLAGQPVLPTELYVRTDPQSTAAVGSVLAATVDPASPQDVTVTNPTDVLTARADASSALQGLFLALGAVALAVGGIGVANVMVIAVLERRGEIGLRRALGARRTHIGIQFLAESSLLAVAGGGTGALFGGFATTLYAAARHWDAVVPLSALLLATGAALAVGAAAGIYPALRAASFSPAEGLRTM